MIIFNNHNVEASPENINANFKECQDLIHVGIDKPSDKSKLWIEQSSNMINPKDLEYGYISENDSIIFAYSNLYDISFYDVENIKKMSFSTTSTTLKLTLAEYDKNKRLLSRKAAFIFELSNETKFIRFFLSDGRVNSSDNPLKVSDIENAKAKLEIGDVSSYEPYVEPKIYANNQLIFPHEKKCNLAYKNFNLGNELISTNSTTFADISSNFLSFETKKESSTILIFLKIGGLYLSNSSYEMSFDIKMDDKIFSNSGSKNDSVANHRGNVAIDGSLREMFNDLFIFINVSKGVHTFKPQWKVTNEKASLTTGQYSNISMQIIEV